MSEIRADAMVSKMEDTHRLLWESLLDAPVHQPKSAGRRT
jgi:hypothetical protein